MRTQTLLIRVSWILLAVGFLITAIAGYLNANSEAGDANIGAALLYFFGVVVGAVGIVMTLVVFLLGTTRHNR